MRLSKSTFSILLGISFFLNACEMEQPVGESQAEPTTIPVVLSTPTPVMIETIEVDLVVTENADEYDLCGPGNLIEVPFFFKDQNGAISPTQVVRFQTTSDNVRRYVSVITCLEFDEGWTSDPAEVEGGYENVIVFFDKLGKGHPYRIIIGGHYIDPHDPLHKDITASLNGVVDHFFYVEDWIATTRDAFISTGSRQIGVNIYLEDNNYGDLSRVLEQVYEFKDTNLQIEEALKTGEGYPEQVPEDFYLFAIKSWLIKAD